MHSAVRDLLLGRQRNVLSWIDQRRAVIAKHRADILQAEGEIERWQAENAELERLLKDEPWQEPERVVLTSDTPITVTKEPS